MTAWLTLVPAIIGAAVVIGSLFYWARRREASEAAMRAAAAWESNFEAERKRAERLEVELAELRSRNEALEARVAELERELRRRPDMTELLELVDKRTSAILVALGKEAE